MAAEWWEKPPPGDGGLCAGCALQPTCPQAGDDYTRCPVTGGSPPPAPPGAAPGAVPDDPPLYDVGPTMDTTSASLGLIEAATGLLNRLHPADDGEPDYRAVLQPLRNGWGIAIATLVPVGSQPMAFSVADQFADGGVVGLLFAPLGGVLMAVAVVWIGSHVPGALGAILTGVRALAVRGLVGALAVLRSRWSWLITRPLVWAAVIGVLIVVGRPIVRILTGA